MTSVALSGSINGTAELVGQLDEWLEDFTFARLDLLVEIVSDYGKAFGQWLEGRPEEDRTYAASYVRDYLSEVLWVLLSEAAAGDGAIGSAAFIAVGPVVVGVNRDGRAS